MTWWQILLIVCGCLLFLSGICFLLLNFTAEMMVKTACLRQKRKPVRKIRKRNPRAAFFAYAASERALFEKRQFERLTAVAPDGTSLSGRLYRAEEKTEKTVLCMHGYHSGWQRDFAGILPFLIMCGYNVLAVDARAHGESGGEAIGFGPLDRHDITAWVDTLCGVIPHARVALYGISMGAATMLLAAGHGVGEPVTCVIADSGYTVICDEMRHVLRRMPGGRSVIIALADRKLKRRYGTALRGERTTDALPSCRVPVLFIYGSADNFVPGSMTLQNYAACPHPKRLVKIEGARHLECFFKGGEQYKTALTTFLREYL